MNTIQTAAIELAKELDALGIYATADPRNLNPPCVWFTPERLQSDRLKGGISAIVWDFYIISPDNGDPFTSLGDLADKIVSLVPIDELRATTVTVPNLSPDPLPALHFTLETEIN